MCDQSSGDLVDWEFVNAQEKFMPFKAQSKVTIVQKFLSDESGATAIEYGLIAAGISVVIVGVTQLVGQNLIGVFTAVAAALQVAAR
jgi:pilus assembly protein Flp/PilA